MKSKHQQKREARLTRIVDRVGSRERAIKQRWEATIQFYDRALGRIEELRLGLARIDEIGISLPGHQGGAA